MSFVCFSSQLVWMCRHSSLVFFLLICRFLFWPLVFLGLCVYPRFWHTMGRWLLFSVSSILATPIYLCDSLPLSPIVAFHTSKLVLLSFCKFLVYFPGWVYSFQLVSQYIRLVFTCILSRSDLVYCFHISCMSKWSPRYITRFVCVKCVPFN